jgi:hypothetical protein
MEPLWSREPQLEEEAVEFFYFSKGDFEAHFPNLDNRLAKLHARPCTEQIE